MAVFRVERTRDYTVMSNYHLRDKRISLKAKGLLSMMLSLPDDWNYTTRGLAKICKEGVDAIGGALRELENCGYIVRHRLRKCNGRICDTEYVIFEQPQSCLPDTESPDTENPYLESPDTEKTAEPNIEKSSIERQSKEETTILSNHFCKTTQPRLEKEAMSVEEIGAYRALIMENIEYDQLCKKFAAYREELDEIVELIVDTICSVREYTRVSGGIYPHEVVRSRFLKLHSEHIEYVLECMQRNTAEVKNIKQYLLTVLYNAPVTVCNYIAAQVNHDLSTGER